MIAEGRAESMLYNAGRPTGVLVLGVVVGLASIIGDGVAIWTEVAGSSTTVVEPTGALTVRIVVSVRVFVLWIVERPGTGISLTMPMAELEAAVGTALLTIVSDGAKPMIGELPAGGISDETAGDDATGVEARMGADVWMGVPAAVSLSSTGQTVVYSIIVSVTTWPADE